MRFLLDTHVWIWAQLEPERLSTAVADLIAASGPAACLSPVTFYEALLLAERGKVRIEMEPADWIRTSLVRRPMTVLDVTTDVAVVARALPAYDNADPFDRFLLATARVHQIPIVTKDRSMAQWGGVQVIW